MATIIPAILSATQEGVMQKLLHAKAFASEVQIDIVDGTFTHPSTWPYSTGHMLKTPDVPALPHMDSLRVELDLMVDDPEKTLGTWMKTGATRILFHLESTTHLTEIIQSMQKEYGYDKDFMTEALSIGVAVGQETPLELLEPYVPLIDYVQFMGIKRIGVQGQPFSQDVLRTISIFKKRHPHIPIQVDGGVTLQTAIPLLQIGVSRLVVGSALWQTPNPAETYAQFEELTLKHGLFRN